MSLGIAPAASAEPLAFAVPPQVADRQMPAEPAHVHLEGFLGLRSAANATNRLLAVDEDRLLASYRSRPGLQAWDGEHVGKWLHAATLAWANTGDPALRAKLDRVVAGLLACQQPDGYLGTYLPEKRWISWDVWAHKYNLIGLLTYIRYTGDTTPLPACRRMADLLVHDLGDAPGQRSILEGSPHVGMAHSSVLEPMVWLYRLTNEPRYLEFCRMILRAWDGPNGPRLISDLTAGKGVNEVANAKAYEMMSCLNGALELYRVTGDPQILQAVRHAWSDITARRLYLTGTCSHHEHFHADHELPNARQNVAETCVTVTWLQLNAHLLHLTGEAAFADELERTAYNQLLAAQRPDGRSWGYYVELEDNRKPFSEDFAGHCCLSSGPRGVALLPTVAAGTDADGAIVNFYERGEYRFALPDGRRATLRAETDYPLGESIRLTLAELDRPGPFTLKLRIPGWARGATVTAAGATTAATAGSYHAIRREWQAGDVVELTIPARPRLVLGTHGNVGLAAVLYGPLVLAADDRVNPRWKIGTFQLFERNIAAVKFAPVPAAETATTLPGVAVFEVRAASIPEVAKGPREQDIPVRLVLFADAGWNAPYKVWVPVWLWTVPPEAALGAPTVVVD